MCIREKSIVSFTQINNIGIEKNSFKYLARALIHFAYYGNLLGKFFYLMFLAAVRKSPFKYKHFYQQKNLRKIRLKHFKPHRLAVQLLRMIDGNLFYTFAYLIFAFTNYLSQNSPIYLIKC